MSEIDWKARALLAEAALIPFAAEKAPSPRRTEIAYDRNGIRCSMSPLMIAQTNAWRVLQAAHKEPRTIEMSSGDRFLRTMQHHLEDCATYLRTLYKQHKIPPTKWGIDPDKVEAAAAQLGVYRLGNSINLKTILAELDDLMQGYDWIGTGSTRSGQLEQQEWTDLRDRLHKGVAALAG